MSRIDIELTASDRKLVPPGLTGRAVSGAFGLGRAEEEEWPAC